MEDNIQNAFQRGTVVWAKMGNYPWWPALVLDEKECQKKCRPNFYWLFWFADHRVSQMPKGRIAPFKENFAKNFSEKVKKQIGKAVDEALKLLATINGLSSTEEDALKDWAKQGFPSTEHFTVDFQWKQKEFPKFIQDSLPKKTVVQPVTGSIEEVQAVVNEVRTGGKSLEDICIGCCRRNKELVQPHPQFLGHVCRKCKKDVDRINAKPVGKTYPYCIICGQGGSLLYCSIKTCKRAFCKECITYLHSAKAYGYKVIKKEWECYLCVPVELDECLIRKREVDQKPASFTPQQSSSPQQQSSSLSIDEKPSPTFKETPKVDHKLSSSSMEQEPSMEVEEQSFYEEHSLRNETTSSVEEQPDQYMRNSTIIDEINEIKASMDASTSEDSEMEDGIKQVKELVKQVLSGKKSLEDICVACCKTNGELVQSHPLFQGKVCNFCKVDVDRICNKPPGKSHKYCIICGQGGTLVYCSERYCKRAFCEECITFLDSEESFDRISSKKWPCYLCEPVQRKNCLIKRRSRKRKAESDSSDNEPSTSTPRQSSGVRRQTAVHHQSSTRTEDSGIEYVIDALMSGRETIEDVCIACLRQNVELVMDHPLFVGKVCSKCEKDVMSICTSSPGNMHNFCIVCGQGGDLVYCGHYYCLRAYCSPCVSYLDRRRPEYFESLSSTINWQCYYCKNIPSRMCFIRKRHLGSSASVFPSSDMDTDSSDFETDSDDEYIDGTRQSRFNPDVLNEKDDNGDIIGKWCMLGSKPWEAICCICDTVINCTHHGSCAAKRHARNASHIAKCKKNRKDDGTLKAPPQLRFSAASVSGRAATVLSHADKVLSAEILFAFSLVASNASYKYADIASKIFPKIFPDSQIAKDFACGRKKLSYVISDGIGTYIKEQLKSEIVKSNTFYSLQIDETPVPEKRIKQLDINIRFFSETQKEIVSNHLESFHIGHANSQILFEKVNDAVSCLPQEKLISVFSDGPNVMKSLKKKIDEQYPNILDIGTCNLHVIHNSFAKGLENFGGDVETLLIDLYYFFKRSAVQSEELKDLQIKFGLPEHVLLRHVDSRWLTLNSSIDRFIEQFNALREFFSMKKDVKTVDTARFKKICEMFSSKTLFAKALFLKNVSNMFLGVQNLFQREEPLIHVLYDEHEKLIRTLMGRFLKSQYVSGISDITTIDIEKGDNWLAHAEIGADTENELKKLEKSDKSTFYLGARSFYLTCTKYLLSKLPLRNKLLKNLKCLHPLFISEPSSVNCLKTLVSFTPFIIPPDKVSTLIDEWHCLQTEDINSIVHCTELEQLTTTNSDSDDDDYGDDISSYTQRIDHFWRCIFDLKNNLNSPKYKLLSILVKALLTLAHGNADCERGFSVNNCLLEKRSNLNIQSINGLRQIKSFLKKIGNNFEKIDVSRDMLNAVRNSRQAYQARINAENVNKQQKQKVSPIVTELQKEVLEEKELQNKLTAAQTMLTLAEKHIADGLQQKDLKLIESGQVLLKEAKEKIPILTKNIKENKERQLKLNEQAHKKRKI